MNSSLAFAVFILVLVGGGIAYLADWLGLTLGKKRLTVGKLRPRDSARLLTVIAGALIALLTFGILLLANHGFYIAISRGADILRHNRELSHENKTLQLQAQTALDSAVQARTDAAAAEQRRTLAASQLEQVNSQLTAAKLANLQTQQALTNRQAQLQTATAQLAQTHNALAQANVSLAQAKLVSAQLEARNKQVEANLSAVERSVGPRLVSKRQSELIYRNGAEIGRTVVWAGQPVSSIRQEITSFIAQLSSQAMERGAVRGGSGRAVEVATVAILTDRGNDGGVKPHFADESESIAALADQIHSFDSGNGSVVVVATAFGNAFAGEQAIVTLNPYSNRLAIKKGTVLGETTISPTDGDTAAILASLQKFLVRSVRPAAIQAGIIPVVDPQVHEIQIGDVTLADLYHIVEEVRKIPDSAIVTATAAQDTYSADQVHLLFTVRQASTGAQSVSGG